MHAVFIMPDIETIACLFWNHVIHVDIT